MTRPHQVSQAATSGLSPPCYSAPAEAALGFRPHSACGMPTSIPRRVCRSVLDLSLFRPDDDVLPSFSPQIMLSAGQDAQQN